MPAKSSDYFAGARRPFIDLLPHHPEGRLLEIGCGAGGTAAYALAEKKCGWACGIELCPEPGALAAQKLQKVLIGNIEKLDLDFPEEYFDVLILSEVLEHLVDPWNILRRLCLLLKKNDMVVAGSPNVCHYQVIRSLLRGTWRRDSSGIFDATHLRWFSPQDFEAMFTQCGFAVDKVWPANPLRPKTRVFNFLTGGRWRHLLHPQTALRAHRPC